MLSGNHGYDLRYDFHETAVMFGRAPKLVLRFTIIEMGTEYFDTVQLPKFYNVIAQGLADYTHGTRLVYPMEGQAMRFLNLCGNRFFGWALSAILGQRIKDTLCGTKVLLRRDYDRVQRTRSFLGDFDPFGDFDLLFGAAKASLRIVELPVRYRARTYGETKISRFRHGLLLSRMTLHAYRKFRIG